MSSMSTHDDGGPAFPTPDTYHPSGQIEYGTCGMPLRDWFAGQALQGWLAGPCGGDTLEDYDDNSSAFAQHQAAVAVACYGYADAMLAARKGKQ